MAGKLQDKVAVITGAARGVGRCTALLICGGITTVISVFSANKLN